jgi:hypothetical protein
MPQLATMVFTTRSGAKLSLEPHSGKSGAVGIFMPREGVDQFFPLPKYSEQYAESPGTEGGRRVLSEVDNATGTGTVIVAGDDQVSFRSWHQKWQEFVEEMRREGGTLAYTPAEGVAVTYELESMSITGAKYDGVQMLAFVQEFEFEFVCRPFGLLSSEDQTLRDHDPFSRDTISSGEWSFGSGVGTLVVEEEMLVPTSTTTKTIGRPALKAADSITTCKIKTGASIASGNTGHLVKYLSAGNYLVGQVTWSGATTTLSVRKLAASVESTLGTSTTIAGLAANTTYWLQTSVVGNTVTVALYAGDPEIAQTPLKTFQVVLGGGDATTYGSGVYGTAGMQLAPQNTDWRLDEWRWDSKQFRATSPFVSFELPNVKGHVDALGELNITDFASVNRRYADYGLEKAGQYDPASAPPILIDSDQMVTAGFSGVQGTRSGAYDPLASGTSVVRTTLSVYPAVVCSTGIQKHVGPYRPKVRCFTTGIGPMFVRFAASGYGNSGQFIRGEWMRVPSVEGWCEIDLGVVEATAARAGTQGWEVRIEAFSENSGDTIDVDYLLLFGAGRYGKSKAKTLYETPTNVAAFDQFNQEEGVLTGKKVGQSTGELVTKFPTTSVNDASSGSIAWVNPGFATATDTSYATTETTTQQSTNYLKATGFGFSIPAEATVLGIVVTLNRKATYGPGATANTWVFDTDAMLVKAGVIKWETDQAQEFTNKWPEVDEAKKFGSSTSLWNNTWTPAQINESGFGFAFRAVLQSGTGNPLCRANINSVTIGVYYQVSGGSTWLETSTASPKYEVKATLKRVERIGTADTANVGRKVTVPGELTDTVVQADVGRLNIGGNKTGIMARYKSSNEQRLVLAITGSPYKVWLLKYTGNTAPVLLNKPEAGWQLTKVLGQLVSLRLQVDSNGCWIAWADGLKLGTGYHASLAVGGGELSSGKAGLYDEQNTNGTSVWDNFVVWPPEIRAAVWSGRTALFRSADAIRENSVGGFWSPAINYEGARLRVPPAGPSGQTSRVSVHARRANVDESVDEWISDEMRVSLRVTPRVVLLG